MHKIVLLAINARYIHSSLSVWALAGGITNYVRSAAETETAEIAAVETKATETKVTELEATEPVTAKTGAGKIAALEAAAAETAVAGTSAAVTAAADIAVIETTINQSVEVIAGQVEAENPSIIGISTYIWNARLLPDILNILRQSLPRAVIVLGGPEASFNARHWLSLGADYVLRGEGECSFPVLIEAILKGLTLTEMPRVCKSEEEQLLESIPGLCWLAEGQFRENAERAPTGTPPTGMPSDPYSPAWFSSLKGRIAYLETSRGCPFTCAFCLSGYGRVRFFPLERAKQQLSALSLTGARTIKLVDRTFNCNPDRAYTLFEYIIHMDTDCCFHFEVAADLFDERTIALLGTAPPGRIQLEAGLQSFFEPTLLAVSRHTDIQKLERNIRAIRSFENIHLHIDLIAGLPLETFTEFQNSFNRAYTLGAHKLQLGFLKLLHGSALRAQAQELKIEYSQLPPYEIISSAWISAAELDILHKAEDALEHTYNSGRFLSALSYVLTAAHMDPFELYRSIGENVAHNSMPLIRYAEKLYVYFCGLPGIRSELLRDIMVCDILTGAKGTSLPPLLRIMDKRHNNVAKMAAEYLGHKASRRDTAVLATLNQGVFAGAERNRVTGLFELHFVDLPEN